MLNSIPLIRVVIVMEAETGQSAPVAFALSVYHL